MDDEVYIYQVDTAEGSISLYQLYEIYKINDESAPIVKKFGSWLKGGGGNQTVGLNIVTEDKNYRRNNLGVSSSATHTHTNIYIYIYI